MNNEKSKMPTAVGGGHRLRNDIIFIAVLLIVVSAIGLSYFFFRGEGDTVEVSLGGKERGSYSLNEDRTVEIKSERGYNILVIKDGEAYVSEASCPDGICSAHKPVSRDGESIICLPNEVVISVSAKDSENTPDIVS